MCQKTLSRTSFGSVFGVVLNSLCMPSIREDLWRVPSLYFFRCDLHHEQFDVGTKGISEEVSSSTWGWKCIRPCQLCARLHFYWASFTRVSRGTLTIVALMVPRRMNDPSALALSIQLERMQLTKVSRKWCSLPWEMDACNHPRFDMQSEA